jgi:hypothetical protein
LTRQKVVSIIPSSHKSVSFPDKNDDVDDDDDDDDETAVVVVVVINV